MKAQYPNANIDARENNRYHDRYLIIDGNSVFHFGHSFHDLGGKASQVNKVGEATNKDKILKNFYDWWNTGNTV